MLALFNYFSGNNGWYDEKVIFVSAISGGSYFGQYIYKRIILIVVMRKHKQKLTNVHTKIFNKKMKSCHKFINNIMRN